MSFESGPGLVFSSILRLSLRKSHTWLLRVPRSSNPGYASIPINKGMWGRHGSPLYAKSGRRMGHPEPWLGHRRQVVAILSPYLTVLMSRITWVGTGFSENSRNGKFLDGR